MTLASLLLLLAKVTVVLGAALLLVRALRGASAGARHLVWLIALTAALSLPLIELIAPFRLAVLPASFPATVLARAAEPSAAVAPTTNPTFSFDATTEPASSIAAFPSQPATLESPAASLLDRAGLTTGTALLLLWLGGALAITAWLAQGWFAANRIVRRARVIANADWLDPMYEVADRIGLDESPRLVQSDEVRMPFACGLITPTIVLPADCDGWSSDRRRAVLLHELAHVRRRDLIGHTLSRLVCAVYWFHPLVWMAAGRLRSESEQACDDLAVGSGARAADYAEHLLDIVTSVRTDSTPNVAMAMARRSEFEGRMLAILDPERPRRGVTRRQASTLLTAMGAITLLVGAAAPATTRSPDAGDAPMVDRGENTVDSRVLADAHESARTDTGAARRSAPMPRPMPAPLPIADPTDPEDPASPASMDARMQRSIERSVERSAERAASMGARVAAEVIGGKPPANTAPRAERVVLLARLAQTDSSASVRRIAVWGLRDFAEEFASARAALVAVLRDDSNPQTREMAAWALSQASGSAEEGVALAEAVRRDGAAPVRATAAWALGRIRSVPAMPALTAALGDSDRRVRIRAAWALGTIDLPKAPPALLAMLKEPSDEARRIATWAIRRSADATAIPALRAAMQVEATDELRVAYLRTLTVLGANSADAIQGLLDSGDPKFREEAIRLLAGSRRPDPWPWPWPDPRPFP
jgi:beta-lactamase regulating signal transducer with metallopeptidase domain